MAWSNSIPRAAGFYWYRHNDGSSAEVVQVLPHEWGPPIVMFFQDVSSADPETLVGDFWDQPLAPPE